MKPKKILIPCKMCIDYNVAIRIKPDGSGINTDQVKMSMNPFDAIAVEAAVQLNEQGIVDDICLIHIGPKESEAMLRYGLALGAHRAIHIESEAMPEPFHVAQIIKSYASNYDCILMGKLAIDGDHSQVGSLLAGMLEWPQATCASNIDFRDDHAIIECEVDNGIQVKKTLLPAVITTDLRLNEPRYATLPNIMKAKQKPIERFPISQLSHSLEQHTIITYTEEPQTREPGVIAQDWQQFLSLLKEHGL